MNRKLVVDGVERHYDLFIPDELDFTKPASLILAFHGGGGTPAGFATLTQLTERGRPLGFIIAYPAGYQGFWHSGDLCCGPPFTKDIDDVAFVRAIIDDISLVVDFEKDHIFAAGWSNGGKMAYRIACEISDRIASIAVVGSSLGVSKCNPSRPISVLAFHGTADTFSPYYRGRGTATNFRMLQLGAPETISRWAGWNGCTDEKKATYERGDARCTTHTECSKGTTVTLCTIEGMGHQWPGHTFAISAQRARMLGLPEVFAQLGPGTDYVDATDMLLAFFKGQFPR